MRLIPQVLKALSRRRGYTLSIVAVMAIASALMTTVFAVVDGVLFKPLAHDNCRGPLKHWFRGPATALTCCSGGRRRERGRSP